MERFIHDEFVHWGKSHGLKINGLKPAQLPGKGMGIVATKKLKKGERVAFVPTRLILAINTIEFIARKEDLDKLSVHGRLAVYLADTPARSMEFLKPWMKVFTPIKDIEQSIPMFWPKAAQECLPPGAKAVLQNQTKKFNKDIAEVLPVAGQGLLNWKGRERYLYYWFIVNTRCFYWDGANQGRNLSREDCMALCPFIDYFNHGKEGCTVSFSAAGYSVHCEYDYQPGEEITVSYGSYSNDNILADYGFIMAENPADHVLLDHLIVPRLSDEQRERLKHAKLLENYVLDLEQICHRTQSALRILLLSERKWQQFVAGRYSGEAEQTEVDALCAEILRDFLVEVELAKKRISAADFDSEIGEVLGQRWEQIETILQVGLERVSS